MKTVQETRFEYKGFPCVVLFQSMGHRCGYVGLPKGNRFYGKHFSEIDDDISCHGGFTYSRNKLILQEDTDLWWIGFDCAHCFDKMDYEKAKEYFSDNKGVMEAILYRENMDAFFGDCGQMVRTLEYCIEECKSIVDQIVGDE